MIIAGELESLREVIKGEEESNREERRNETKKLC